MRSAVIWLNSALSRRRDAMARPNCSRSLLMRLTIASPAAAQRSRCSYRQYAATTAEIGVIEKRIHAWHRSCEESQRLEEIPGIGPIVATALVAEVGDWKAFSSGRNLAAWIGLVPRATAFDGRQGLGRISKQGNRHLRRLLVAGAMAVIRYARQHGTNGFWLAYQAGTRRPIRRGRLHWQTRSRVLPGHYNGAR